MLLISQITTEVCSQRFSSVLRDYIGPGKSYSYESAADALGMERRTIESYVLGESMPPLPKLMRIFALLGPAMANRILRLAGLDAAVRQCPEQVSDLDLNADAGTLIAKIAYALQDGRIEPHERAAYIDDVRRLVVTAQEFLAQNDGVAEDTEVEPTGTVRVSCAGTRRSDA